MTFTATHVHPGFGDEVAQHGVTPPDDCVEIGDGVCIRPSLHWRSDQGETEAAARIVGYVVAHDVEEFGNRRCEGALSLERGFGPPIWKQVGSLAAGDLTLSPSVLCKRHEAFHGYVRNGQWVPV